MHICLKKNLEKALNFVLSKLWEPWMRLGDGVADDAVAMLLPLWLHAAALWHHAVWIHIVTSHNAWMGYEYSLQNLNGPRAIHMAQGRFTNIILTLSKQ